MKPLRLTRPEPSETQVLRACLDFCQWCPDVAFAWRCNTGAGKIVRKDGSLSQWMEWGFVGAPDIHGFLINGRALYIETKRPSENRARQAQKEFLAFAEKNQCVAVIARGHEDVKQVIDKAMGRIPK